MPNTMSEIDHLEHQLDDFDPSTRAKALRTLVQMADSGQIEVQPMRDQVNLHCHSFFSYNGYGYSPSRLAWLGKKQGIRYMGVVDFDVLDAVDEFLDACRLAGVRGIAGIETRVFIPEFSQREINSPGEPGVCYHMGTGFTSTNIPGEGAQILAGMRSRAAERNRDMLDRINAFLAPLVIDYEKDVLPLTPAGNATERHMVQVIADKADETQSDPAAFWSGKFGLPDDEITHIMRDRNAFHNFLRSQLMKQGGVGYVQPTPASFPTVDEFHRIMKSAGALPCSAWLDGTSAGEQRMDELLDLMMEKGVAAINIVPDRNWNYKDPAVKKDKMDRLYALVELAEKLALPVLIGTEMNKFGQKLVDDLDQPELHPLKDTFLKGAAILFGHTQLQRYAGMGYLSDWADQHFSGRAEKNSFYAEIGNTITPGFNGRDGLSRFSPQELLKHIDISEGVKR